MRLCGVIDTITNSSSELFVCGFGDEAAAWTWLAELEAALAADGVSHDKEWAYVGVLPRDAFDAQPWTEYPYDPSSPWSLLMESKHGHLPSPEAIMGIARFARPELVRQVREEGEREGRTHCEATGDEFDPEEWFDGNPWSNGIADTMRESKPGFERGSW